MSQIKSPEIIIDLKYYSLNTPNKSELKQCIKDTLNLMLPIICITLIITGIILLTSTNFGHIN